MTTPTGTVHTAQVKARSAVCDAGRSSATAQPSLHGCVELTGLTPAEVLPAGAQMRRAHRRAVEERAVTKVGRATVAPKPGASPQSVLELSSYSSDDSV